MANPTAPSTWGGKPVTLKDETAGGAPGKNLGALKSPVTGSEYATNHNYDTSQQDADKSRSR